MLLLLLLLLMMMVVMMTMVVVVMMMMMVVVMLKGLQGLAKLVNMTRDINGLLRTNGTGSGYPKSFEVSWAKGLKRNASPVKKKPLQSKSSGTLIRKSCWIHHLIIIQIK